MNRTYNASPGLRPPDPPRQSLAIAQDRVNHDGLRLIGITLAVVVRRAASQGQRGLGIPPEIAAAIWRKHTCMRKEWGTPGSRCEEFLAASDVGHSGWRQVRSLKGLGILRFRARASRITHVI